MPRLLAALPTPSGPDVLKVLPVLAAALSGAGPALLPHPPGRPPPARFRAGQPLGGGEDADDDPTAVAVATSGSSGGPRAVLLPASALLASVSATHDRLGGPGRWLLALPAQHVAGLQVLLRSLVSGVPPGVLDLAPGFRPEAFAAAAGSLGSGRRYTSLVPTQLARLLHAGGRPLAALAGFDAVLVGGAVLPMPLRERAAAAGVRVVISYGMSETCGGCVYDGLALDGVIVGIEPSGAGRITLAGPVLARGYRAPARARGTPPAGAFTRDGDGVRWFRTDDAGRLVGGRLELLGRLDDTVVTGGLTVAPAAVEAVLLGLAAVREAVVFGVPDGQWGQRVVAAVVPAPGADAPTLPQVRRAVTAQLAAHAAPRQLLVLDRMPLRGPGKPDRARLARRAAL